jgi:hypothetical protein
VREFLAEVLADNSRMSAVFKGSGFPIERSTEFGVERVLLTIADEPQSTKKCSEPCNARERVS